MLKRASNKPCTGTAGSHRQVPQHMLKSWEECNALQQHIDNMRETELFQGLDVVRELR